MLLIFQPEYLQLEEQWVDMLLEAEQDKCDNDGLTCLMFLLMSNYLLNFDFSCRRFNKLFNDQMSVKNSRGFTALMALCWINP